MFNKSDTSRNCCQLTGGQARQGYDWWWHSFTGINAETGQQKAFFIEFFLCNPASGGDKPVFGQLPENRENGIKPSYLMVKAGSWGSDAAQLHRFFSWKEAKVDWGNPYSIEAADCSVCENATRGSIRISPDESYSHPEWMCDSGFMSWDLKIRKKTAYNMGYGAGKLFRSLQLFEMFWHAEGMASEFEGEVVWNGEIYKVEPESSYGYADKNWGKDFTSPWVWLSSCNLTSEISGAKLKDSVFDIGGGRPKCGPVVLDRKLLSAFWYEGREFEFNFSKFWTGCRTRFDCRETDTQIIWHVDQRTWFKRMVTDVVCDKANMLLVNYEAPNGSKRHNRLWNGGTGSGTVKLYRFGRLVDRIHAENIGCEWGEYEMLHPEVKLMDE
ncbi:MAG: hypothetical protein HUJ94_08360 [Bacteroidales bacterium]|nr:hypothetical protein [Bacteroidales bacterium]